MFIITTLMLLFCFGLILLEKLFAVGYVHVVNHDFAVGGKQA